MNDQLTAEGEALKIEELIKKELSHSVLQNKISSLT